MGERKTEDLKVWRLKKSVIDPPWWHIVFAGRGKKKEGTSVTSDIFEKWEGKKGKKREGEERLKKKTGAPYHSLSTGGAWGRGGCCYSSVGRA